MLRPVTRLSAAARQVAETRQFDADIRVEGSDELGALATSFNSMLSTLRASREQQQRLVRDANHELRTPLTSLRTNIGVLRRRGDQLDQQEHDDIVDEMDGEVRELTDLVTEYQKRKEERKAASQNPRSALSALPALSTLPARRNTGTLIVGVLIPFLFSLLSTFETVAADELTDLVGLALGRGQKLDDILSEMGGVAEGVQTTRAACRLGDRVGVELPISNMVREVIDGERTPAEAGQLLMTRQLRSEKD